MLAQDVAAARQAHRRLDHDGVDVELAGAHPLRDPLEHDDEVLPDGAADAAVHHLDDLLSLGLELGVLLKQAIVNAHVAKLVLDYCNLLPMLCRQDVVEKCRLAGAEEAGEHGDGDERVVGRRHGFYSFVVW